MKRIYIKADTESVRALKNANVPFEVIESIIGTEQQMDEHFQVESSAWINQPIKWVLPPQCLKLIEEKE